MNGTGPLTLTGTNTYSGGTTISGGTLSIAADGNLRAVPTAPTPGSINLNGGVLQVTGTTAFATPTINSNRGITLGVSGGTISVTAVATGTAFGNAATVQYSAPSAVRAT